MAKLTGTDPDQVPTNADLGTMAYTQIDNLPQISAKWVDVYDPNNRQSNLEIHTSDYYRDSGDPDLAYNWRFTNEGNVNRLRLMGENTKMSPTNIFPLYVEGDTQDIVLSGNVRMSNGQGIDFSASEGSNASSSVLDDYEEGAWTPGIVGTTSGSLTMGSSNKGFYTKVGRQVHVCGTIHVSGTETLTGSLKLTGLPFSTNSTTNYRANGAPVTNTMLSLPSSTHTVGIGVDAGQTFAWIVGKDDYGKTYSHTPGQFSTGYFYGFSMTYETN